MLLSFSLKLLIISQLCHIALAQLDTYDIVSPLINFVVHREGHPKYLINDFSYDSQFVATICPATVNISWVIHGHAEGYFTRTTWVRPIVANTLKAAGGCVIVMDYSFYSGFGKGYGEIVGRYQWLRDVLVNAMKMFGGYDRMHCFGFSFGARLCIAAGNNLTNENLGVPIIGRMDLCDPAGPDFDWNSRKVPAMNAAKNVACINTSEDFGTKFYDCHQNFRMGHCGRWQDGATVPPKMSHGMCPYIYNYAFTYDYVYNSLYENQALLYTPYRNVNETCKQNMIMGYRNTMYCIGDINIPTSKCAPFVYTGNIYNYPTGTTICPAY